MLLYNWLPTGPSSAEKWDVTVTLVSGVTMTALSGCVLVPQVTKNRTKWNSHGRFPRHMLPLGGTESLPGATMGPLGGPLLSNLAQREVTNH